MSEWRPVPGYEGAYEVSEQGQVRSLDRMVDGRWGPASFFVRGRILEPAIDDDGYPRVKLHRSGAGCRRGVHQLVALAFIGPCPPGQQVRHKDGNSGNPRLSNLHYGTPSENMQDAVAHGTHPRTRRTHCPRGHRLIAPNLAPTQLARGQRSCWACRLAIARVHAHPELELQAESDRRYALIMASEHTPDPCRRTDHVPAPHRTAGTTLPPAVPGRW